MPQTLSSEERGHLDRATALARRGWGRVHRNPMVGCVLVKDGVVVGEGWHAEFGGPHAERVALEQAGVKARGSTAFVSLEPCAHQGKTPPCADSLAQAGVVRVVYAVADPGPGAGGHARLQALGVGVQGPIDSEGQGRELNPGFFRRELRETPYLLLKMALSLDGRASSGRGETTRITGPEADAEVQRLRAGFDAIMVGVGTVLVDDPRLSARPSSVEVPAQPLRCVVDTELRTPLTARLFDPAELGGAVHLFCREGAPRERAEALESRGATVHRISPGSHGVALTELLECIKELGVGSLFCEGGPRLATSLLEGDHVHRLVVFCGPSILGPEGIPAFTRPLTLRDWKPSAAPSRFGRDVCFTLDPSS